MSDLVKRLRILDYGIGCEAADRIEELERQLAEEKDRRKLDNWIAEKARNAALEEAAVVAEACDDADRASFGIEASGGAMDAARSIRALKDKPNG